MPTTPLITTGGKVYKYETIVVTTIAPFVVHVELNRPAQQNGMIRVTNNREVGECFNALREDTKCRTIILSGAGSSFSVGLDPAEATSLIGVAQGNEDIARKARVMYNILRKTVQDSFTALEKCDKPVISCINGPCWGGGLHLVCASDIRYCTSDATFRLRGAELGLIPADGGLQRMSKLIGNDGLVRELAITGQILLPQEAQKFGFVRRVFSDKASMLTAATELATTIASISPVAVQGTKHQLNYARDHSVAESMEYQASWSMMTLQSEDLLKAAKTLKGNTKAEFEDY